ncbi:hypothetical protein QBC37DRAFT_374971 [Rhypophila decipiens]|uniref:RRM domain-containing protein n=1 Tax=Rhypophila decipiens TaxID=261697 RepID=A0AAN6Y5H9_9PEZI|nr:hypothetical protein QBC37DRAFT_374971 [Rhypophila decipiens]
MAFYGNSFGARYGPPPGYPPNMVGESSETEGFSDAAWAENEDEGATGTNSKQPQDVRDSTLAITNLPTNTTMKELMTRIAVAGPFGKVYSCHLESQPTPVNPNMSKGEQQLKAYIAFFTRDSAHYFMAYVNDQGICVHGRPMRVRWSSAPVPETLAIVGRHDSRAILVEGPAGMTKPRLDDILRANGINPNSIHDWVIETVSSTKKEAYLQFNTYTVAAAAVKVLDSLVNPPGIFAEYARDPVDVGVKTAWDSENHEKGTKGHLIVIWNDWRIPVDKKAITANQTSSEESDWLKASEKKQRGGSSQTHRRKQSQLGSGSSRRPDNTKR